MRNRWLRGGLIVLAALTFVLVVTGVELRIPAYRYLVRPGLVIVVDWLHIDFWQHPSAAFYLAMVFNALVYGALFALLLELLRFILSRRKSQGKISD